MITCAITGSRGVLGRKIMKNLPYKFYEFKKDIKNEQDVKKWVLKKNFDIVIHLAALVPIKSVNKNFDKAYKTNVSGTLNLINLILKKKIKPKWFFFASSSHVYGLRSNFRKISEKDTPKPQNKYGETKLLAEKLLIKKTKNTSIKLCLGRIFSFTKKNQKPPYEIPSIIKKLKSSKKKINLNNLNNYRDFLNTRDIVKAIDVLNKKNKSGIYNIGSGHKFCLKDIAKLFSKKYKKNVFFNDSNKTSFLISNNKKLKNLNWKPAKFNNNINYFYK